MKNIYGHILYVILFCLGWIGILWSIWVFYSESYAYMQGEIDVFMGDPSFLSNLCISFMSIAMAVLLERTAQQKTS